MMDTGKGCGYAKNTHGLPIQSTRKKDNNDSGLQLHCQFQEILNTSPAIVPLPKIFAQLWYFLTGRTRMAI
jgi:hypothetical protein